MPNSKLPSYTEHYSNQLPTSSSPETQIYSVLSVVEQKELARLLRLLLNGMRTQSDSYKRRRSHQHPTICRIKAGWLNLR